MSDYQFIECDHPDVDLNQVDLFISEAFPGREDKVAFINQHGEWLYRGKQNRVVTMNAEGRLVGHCASIPIRLLIGGQAQPAVWWVDLVLLPEVRGQGIQSKLDRMFRDRPEPIKLAFATDRVAQIHQKHDWLIGQVPMSNLALPLQPMKLKQQFFGAGIKGQLVRLKAMAMALSAMRKRKQLISYQPKSAFIFDAIDVEALAQTFLAHNVRDQFITTFRDADYIQWRYVDVPYHAQLKFYGTGTPQSPDIILVVRDAQFSGGTETRILDIWGNLDDEEGLRDILYTAIRDATRRGALRVLTLSSLPELTQILNSIGFSPTIPRPICWYTTSEAFLSAFSRARHHWSLTDSDNDTYG